MGKLKQGTKRKRDVDGIKGVEERGLRRVNPILITLDPHECFQFFITCKRTNNAHNASHYVKLGKKRREISKRKYYIISPRVIIKAIIIIQHSQISKKILNRNRTMAGARERERWRDCVRD